MQLILASSSQARKRILESLGLKFKVIPSQIDESKISLTNPKLLVQKIAKAKAESVVKRLKEIKRLKRLKERKSQVAIACQVSPSFASQPSLPSYHLVLAADSMVVLDNQTFGKPKDKKEAKQILKQLSGRTHDFITGLYIINTKTKKFWQDVALSKVTLRRLRNKEINAYIAKTNVTRFAGGYTIIPSQEFKLKSIHQDQSPAQFGAEQSDIIKKISGSLTNVMGLPLETLLPILRENGIKI